MSLYACTDTLRTERTRGVRGACAMHCTKCGGYLECGAGWNKIRNNDRPEDMILVDVRDVQAASTPWSLNSLSTCTLSCGLCLWNHQHDRSKVDSRMDHTIQRGCGSAVLAGAFRVAPTLIDVVVVASAALTQPQPISVPPDILEYVVPHTHTLGSACGLSHTLSCSGAAHHLLLAVHGR